MARLKFFLFALIVLGAWAAHLYLLSPALSANAVEQAKEQAARTPSAVLASLQQRRIDLQRAALRLASSPEAMASLLPSRAGARVDAPTAEELAAVKATLSGALTPALAGALVLGLTNEEGTIVARGDEAATDGAGLDLAALTAGTGPDGVTAEAFGQAHQFYALPVTVMERGEAKVVGHLFVGAPLVSSDVMETVAQATHVGALGLVKDGKVVQAAGSQKAMIEKALATAPGKADVLVRGKVAALGPLQLPLLTREDDALGGNAPLFVASREPLSSGGYDVVTVASVAPFMNALAEYQKLAVFAFGGLFGASLLFMLILGGGGAKAPKAPKEKKEKAKKAGKKDEPSPPTEQAQVVADGISAVPPPLPELPPLPEASPDDFQFGSESSAASDASAPPPPPPLDDGLFSDAPAAGSSQLAPEAPTRASQLSAAALFAQQEAMEASAPPAPSASADPFELAAQQQLGGGGGDGDFNPDATRVAAIPQELLRASAQQHEAPAPARAQIAAPPPMQAMARAAPAHAQDPDEAHFQDVFRDFVKTREQCGEPPDGLTYDKFALKLRKNKDQLVAKYNCRTVRFQVYVKEGKAALKATPVKD